MPFLEKNLPLSQRHPPHISLRRGGFLSCGTCVPIDFVKYSGSCMEVMVFSVVLELTCIFEKGAELR